MYDQPENRELRGYLQPLGYLAPVIQSKNTGYDEALWQKYSDSSTGGLEVVIELEAQRNIDRNLMKALAGLFGVLFSCSIFNKFRNMLIY